LRQKKTRPNSVYVIDWYGEMFISLFKPIFALILSSSSELWGLCTSRGKVRLVRGYVKTRFTHVNERLSDPKSCPDAFLTTIDLCDRNMRNFA
jgi:hypothetical protein